MVEQQKKRLEDAISDMIEDMYRTHLRRMQDCNSDARSRLPSNPSDRDMSRSQHMFESCSGNCVDKHINLIPGLLKSIKQTLERGPPKRPGRDRGLDL
ncbi:uncharacterized protein LOC108048636 isoform X2 [Drosophila rhopaloa]|uniref:Uncharacterized protein LOC108048636 isoform X2 n=1 Tax=Drosophila rhopaloa TaxID=1041015 RepID=A0A6P4FCB3_DRORH|nr:uncharacterized protein LOC108048636 isoform X2 [Drosophila rhopaloa]